MSCSGNKENYINAYTVQVDRASSNLNSTIFLHAFVFIAATRSDIELEKKNAALK